ncbi:MAG TPA: oxalate:formate antiporter [Alphaproteobacteria bacterium]
MNSSQNTQSGNAVKLALAWGFVGIPLVWGVLQTLANALKLFQ